MNGEVTDGLISHLPLFVMRSDYRCDYLRSVRAICGIELACANIAAPACEST